MALTAKRAYQGLHASTLQASAAACIQRQPVWCMLRFTRRSTTSALLNLQSSMTAAVEEQGIFMRIGTSLVATGMLNASKYCYIATCDDAKATDVGVLES